MSSRIYQKFRTFVADQILESLTEPANTSYYIVLGKTTPHVSDSNPEAPSGSDHFAQHTFDQEFISGKIVRRTDVSYVIPRYNWISGTRYAQYDHAVQDQYSKNFYTITDEHNVYKCLFNNANTVSTSKPTGVSISPFTTPDGYTWKYMYSITSAEAERFLTKTLMPVKHLTLDDSSVQYDVQQAAISGGINAIEVTNAGSNYRAYTDGIIVSVVNSTAVILNSSANNTQDNHYANSGFYVKGGTGAGQVKIVNNYIAATRTLVVKEPFSPALSAGGLTPSRYKISPQVQITGPDGSNALAVSTVDATSNTIANIEVISVGSGYRRANVSIYAKSEHGSGATARALIGPKGGHGLNAVQELGGDKLMFVAQFTGNESNTVPVGLTFRQISLVKNPQFSNGNFSNTTSPTNIQYTTRLRHTDGGANKFVIGEFIAGVSSGAEGRVVASNSSTVVLTAVQGTFIGNETLSGNTTVSFQPTINGNGVLASDMINNSGELIYVQNVKPVTRNLDQIEDIKLVLDF
jgi:hypothetical protein